MLECRYRVDNIVVVEDKDVVEDENNFEHYHKPWETPALELVYLFVKHLEFPFVYNKLIAKMLFIIHVYIFDKQLISPNTIWFTRISSFKPNKAITRAQ